MSEIKSEKAKDIIKQIKPLLIPCTESTKEAIENLEIIICGAVITAETELTEKYEQKLDELTIDRDRWRQEAEESQQRERLATNIANDKRKIAEGLRDRAATNAKYAFCDSMDIGFDCKKSCPKNKCKGFINFTQKLTEK